MIHLYVAFSDVTFIDEEFPNHQVEDVEKMIEATPKELLCRVEVESSTEILIHTYSRKQSYVY